MVRNESHPNFLTGEKTVMRHLSKSFRRTLTVAAVAAMLVSTAVAASNITKRTIEANYRGIKVVVDGVQADLKDAAGNSVEPFISNGTTYLPLRVIGEALGKEVTWDGTTSTVYVGKVPDKAPEWLKPYLTDHTTVYDGSDLQKFFTTMGEKHTEGFVMESYRYWWNARDCWNGSAVWNTNALYSSMKFTVAHTGNVQHNASLKVYFDGVYAETYELPGWDGAPKTITIPLKYAPNVKLELVGDDMTSTTSVTPAYGFYDISFS